MSEARHQRFEIDLDEIERQLRRSVEGAPAPKADPLAELARIVGQDDPFRGLLGEGRPGGGGVQGAQASHPPARPGGLSAEQHAVLHGTDLNVAAPDTVADDGLFDPVADAYGSADAAMDSETFVPLRPRRTRRRLAGVMAVLALIVVGTGGLLVWRRSGSLGFSGVPPIIKADTSPIKVAPEKPGGIEIPNQNKQIYQPDTQEGKSRVVDNREQPMDVREAVRNSPAPPQALTEAPAPSDGPSTVATLPGTATNDVANTSPSRPSAANSVANALGEPRKVRTVSVRPDGTMFATPAAQVAATSPAMSILTGSLPPPIPVATIPIGPSGASNAPSAPPPATPVADDHADQGGTTPSSGPAPVTVLPPQRPKLGNRSSSATPRGEPASRIAAGVAEPETTGSQRLASLADDSEATAPVPMAPVTAAHGTYSVQIAVMPSEEEARGIYARLSAKYAADLDGRAATFARAEVKGKTLYRVRLGPMGRDDAKTLCTRLKSSGAQCFVAAN